MEDYCTKNSIVSFIMVDKKVIQRFKSNLLTILISATNDLKNLPITFLCISVV
jgi:hypothetical protein